VKPLRRGAAWTALAGGHKALRVESAAALRAWWPRLATLGAPLLVQALIDGPETAIESYHCYVDGRGATVAEFTGRKIRTWPLDCGDSSALTISDAPDVAQAGRAAVKKLKLRGVAKLDFKRAPDGALFLLEVNARFTLWHHLAARARSSTATCSPCPGRTSPRRGPAPRGARSGRTMPPRARAGCRCTAGSAGRCAATPCRPSPGPIPCR
jgi:predicted ATP-grasp superfamily ATP-dependent carboligase